MSEPPHQLIIDAWFNHISLDGYTGSHDEVISEDFIAYAPGGGVAFRGKQGVKKFYTWFDGIFSDRTFQIEDVISQADKLVVRYTGEYSYRGGGSIYPQ